MKTNPNDPANPTWNFQLGEGGTLLPGLTKREYFAAHAPSIVPDWFHHIPSFAPTAPKLEPPEHLRAHCLNWRDDPAWELWDYEEGTDEDRAFLRSYQEEWEQHWAATQDWKEEEQANRYFQWLLWHADNLIAALNENAHGIDEDYEAARADQ